MTRVVRPATAHIIRCHFGLEYNEYIDLQVYIIMTIVLIFWTTETLDIKYNTVSSVSAI